MLSDRYRYDIILVSIRYRTGIDTLSYCYQLAVVPVSVRYRPGYDMLSNRNRYTVVMEYYYIFKYLLDNCLVVLTVPKSDH
jgi:hypothetical protein